MYRLLIVDDVPIIVDGLAELFLEQERYTFEVYQAYSGLEALDVLIKNKIDIVLSDIKMPSMEGIPLLRQIKRQWPECKVIFLTSYTDFDYVQNAISLGAFDYILKTEERDKVVQAVFRAIEKLEDEFASKILVEKAKLHMQRAIPSLQKECIQSLLHGKVDSKIVSEQYFAEIQLPLKAEYPVFLLVARIDSWRNASMKHDRELLVYALQNIMAESLGDRAAFYTLKYKQSQLIWFIQPYENTDENWEHTFYFIKGTLETVQNTCGEILRLSVSFVLGKEPSEWLKIADKFDQLLSLLAQEVGLQSQALLVEGDQQASEVITENQYKAIGFSFERKFKLLNFHLENGEEEQYFIILSELFGYFDHEEINYFLKMEIYHAISSILMSYMNRYDFMQSIADHVSIEKLYSTNEILSWVDLTDYFHKLSRQIFICQNMKRDENTNVIIHKINEYILANLANDISLSVLAEQVYLNPSYLSRLYKSVEGIGISEYIANFRNHTSKKLLTETNMMVQEIAKAVGYQSGLTFNRFFKRYNGVTPQEYRNSRLVLNKGGLE
ncbi:response regulator [Neobacillus niacini]|uniref:response regulator n=1 Tax=Neobacillus niacini TaxID=86668 RepID=UPI002FFF850E